MARLWNAAITGMTGRIGLALKTKSRWQSGKVIAKQTHNNNLVPSAIRAPRPPTNGGLDVRMALGTRLAEQVTDEV